MTLNIYIFQNYTPSVQLISLLDKRNKYFYLSIRTVHTSVNTNSILFNNNIEAKFKNSFRIIKLVKC